MEVGRHQAPRLVSAPWKSSLKKLQQDFFFFFAIDLQSLRVLKNLDIHYFKWIELLVGFQNHGFFCVVSWDRPNLLSVVTTLGA